MSLFDSAPYSRDRDPNPTSGFKTPTRSKSVSWSDNSPLLNRGSLDLDIGSPRFSSTPNMPPADNHSYIPSGSRYMPPAYNRSDSTLILDTGNDQQLQISGQLPSAMNPDVFSGKEDVESWINKFNIFCKIKGWSDEQKTVAMPCFFRNAASAWFESLEDEHKSPLNRLVRALTKRFGPHSSARWEKMDTWDRRNQLNTEGIEEYYQAITKLGKELSMDRNNIRDKFIRGLLPHISEYVKERNPHDINEVLELAKTAHAIRKPRDENVNVAKLSAQISALHNSLSKEMNGINEKVYAVTEQIEDMKKPQNVTNPTPFDQGMKIRTQNPYNATTGHTNNTQTKPLYRHRNPCFRCGRAHHPENCPFINVRCHFCLNIGHIAVICPRRHNNQHTRYQNRPRNNDPTSS